MLTYLSNYTWYNEFVKKVCSGPKCYDTKIHGRGYCAAHYRQKFVLGKDMVEKRVANPGSLCTLDFCDRPKHSNELCSSHWAQVYRYKMEPRPINEFVKKKCARSDCDKTFGTRENSAVLCKSCRARRRRYGVSEEWYISMPSVCEICGSNQRISIDHDHATGRARGALCGRCNTAIGMIDESVETLKNMIYYIESQNG